MPVRNALATAPPWALVALAYLSFISIGIQSGLMGVAWTGPGEVEYLSKSFRQPLDAVGVLLAASTLGYFLVGAVSGRILARFGVGPVLGCSMLAASLSLAGYTVAPGWYAAAVCALFLGAGGGMLDATLNIYFAAHHGVRLMNWLHACFGIGATIGPLVMSTSLAQTGAWRGGFLASASLHLVCTALYFATASAWGPARPLDAETPETPVKAGDTLRLPAVWVGIGMFVAYTGLEMCLGQWGYSLFSLSRKVPEATAAFWVSVYWGSFTVGRIVFGLIGGRFSLSALVRGCLGVGVLASWLLAADPFPLAGPVAVAIFGFAISPIWAMLMLNTQKTLGPDHAPHAIGFQVAAASLGFGLIPGLAGVVAQRYGLETVPWIMVGLGLGMLLLYEIEIRAAHKRG